jgi:hypothetical protein
MYVNIERKDIILKIWPKMAKNGQKWQDKGQEPLCRYVNNILNVSPSNSMIGNWKNKIESYINIERKDIILKIWPKMAQNVNIILNVSSSNSMIGNWKKNTVQYRFSKKIGFKNKLWFEWMSLKNNCCKTISGHFVGIWMFIFH